MKEKIQKFGGAMFTPVMLFSFSGIILALTIIFKNPLVVGDIATKGTAWYNFWDIIGAGVNTVFQQLEILFVIALPIGLAKKSTNRVSMEAFVVYMAFNYFISAILLHYGGNFGVDFSIDAVSGSGLKMIGGIKTLDTGIIGAIIVALIVVGIHDYFFDKKVPDYLAMFNGSSLVVFISMGAVLLAAVGFCFIWPAFQRGMGYIQAFFINSGGFGIWSYGLLERLLLPTGLHHLLTQPFSYGPVIVDEGITKYWLDHLNEFSASTKPLSELFPGGAFKLYGQNKVFAAPAVAAAIYFTAKPEKRKKVAGLVIPAAITSIFAGITEPIEFTFLFVSPLLYGVYAVLCATLSTAMYYIGLRGDFTSGLITWLAKNWIPLWQNHHNLYIKQIAVGLIFSAIFFFVFRYLIIKMDVKTPGREDDIADDDVKLYRKKDYKAKLSAEKDKLDPFAEQALYYLAGLGGAENIESITNCATRLRTVVKDPLLVETDAYFKDFGAIGVVRKDKNVQVIIGPSVPQVKDEVDKLL